MKALKFKRIGQADIVNLPIPVPRKKEVLIKVKAAGICYSDIMAFKGTHPYRVPPVITGHELLGEIAKLGEKVSNLKVGTRVVVEPHIGCGKCFFCSHSHYNLCLNKRLLGTGKWIGAFSEYVIAEEKMCFPMPKGMTFDEGAILEPYCVGLHAIRRAKIGIGENIAILGCGTIGMMTLLGVKLSGPNKIFVTEISSFKRKIALDNGADLAINPIKEDPVRIALSLTGQLGFDVVFIAVPSNEVLKQALEICRKQGRIILIAAFEEEANFNLRKIQTDERTLIGSCMYTSDDYELAIKQYSKGNLNLNCVISKHISLTEAPQIIAQMAEGKASDNIKTIILFD